MDKNTQRTKWQFLIDRGGTFTDIIGVADSGDFKTAKLLSENSEQYPDAAIAGIREILQLESHQSLDSCPIACVKMGTTVATNALLEHKGAKVLLLITKGFGDLLSIGYQNRPEIFALNIKKPQPLYQSTIEVSERINSTGEILKPLEGFDIEKQLIAAKDKDFESVAIVLMHSYKNPAHELKLELLCKKAGFKNIAVSHKLSPLPRIVPRGDTALVDAYLTPIIEKYSSELKAVLTQTTLQFMQSNGGLISADKFRGVNSVLSGPAGGVVGMVETAKQQGFSKIIGFDMGGTSTDICLYEGNYQQTLDTEIAGLRIRAPMLNVHTVAAGGGSKLSYNNHRFQVGPESAGAQPGPTCYGLDGPLTVTDIQVVLGRIRPEYFPTVFGKSSNQQLDKQAVMGKFDRLKTQIEVDTEQRWTVEKIAAGFLDIAIANMSNAVKHLTTSKGIDVEEFAINCFGGAAGQHVCKVAEQLKVKQIVIHPMASLLSAFGMGLADTVIIVQQPISESLSEQSLLTLDSVQRELLNNAKKQMSDQGIKNVQFNQLLSLRYKGSDNCIEVELKTNCPQKVNEITQLFCVQYQQQFGFCENNCIIIDKLIVEARHTPLMPRYPLWQQTKNDIKGIKHEIFIEGSYQSIEFVAWDSLPKNYKREGPLVIYSSDTTIVVEKNWQVELSKEGVLLISAIEPMQVEQEELNLNPIQLELFNNLYKTIAEQMGDVLERTAHSVNIKERLDFSCAIFDADGNLIANAPHMPVHLGSMGESVAAVLKINKKLYVGDAYLINDPYQGGTHLPDLTVVTPIFEGERLIYVLASRGHHADVGGITPGSMPSNSKTIADEGCLFSCFKLLDKGVFQEAALLEALSQGTHPARNPLQNINDLKAQLAANRKGQIEMQKAIEQYGLETVLGYMVFVQDNAEQIMKKVISTLTSGRFEYSMDNEAVVKVAIDIDKINGLATIDFMGSSAQMPNNFNSPKAVSRAAVLYVFRCLIKEDIPLNAGCLRPLTIIIPEHSLLNPSAPAAVVAGNVETSQCITDALFCALGVLAGSQGTMNNLTFGNNEFQYYETIAGGAGAGNGFDGASGVQTHMTNSRITDPEILEIRYPVLLCHFGYRKSTSGKGKYVGGRGLHREIQFLVPMEVNMLSGNRLNQPPGLKGGEAGIRGEHYLLTEAKNVQTLDPSCSFSVKTGDKIIVKTPGGGGFGHFNE